MKVAEESAVVNVTADVSDGGESKGGVGRIVYGEK